MGADPGEESKQTDSDREWGLYLFTGECVKILEMFRNALEMWNS